MGREVRMVPANWNHPAKCTDQGEIQFVPLLEGSFAERAAQYAADKEKWDRGEFPDWASDESKKLPFEEWEGESPSADDYMPDWKPEEKTHLMMYEDTSEGTPISPAFATPEELARWLSDTGASSFGSFTATYEQWLSTCKRGFAPSAIYSASTGLIGGVEAME
jgi:hypothetical protein